MRLALVLVVCSLVCGCCGAPAVDYEVPPAPEYRAPPLPEGQEAEAGVLELPEDADADPATAVLNAINKAMSHLPDVMSLLNTFAPDTSKQAPSIRYAKYHDNKYVVEGTAKPNKFGPANLLKTLSGLADTFLGKGKGASINQVLDLVKNPKYRGYIDVLRSLKELTPMDYLELLAQRQDVRDLLHKASSYLPILEEITGEAAKQGPLYKILDEVVRGETPTTADLVAVASEHSSLDFNVLINAAANNKVIQELVALALNKKAAINDVIALLTTKNLPVENGVDSKHISVTSVDGDQGKLVQKAGQYVTFGLRNFNTLLKLLSEIAKPNPSFFSLLATGLSLDMSALKGK